LIVLLLLFKVEEGFVETDWIARCIDAAREAVSEVDSAVADRLKTDLEAQLSIGTLRPRELNELADQLVSSVSRGPSSPGVHITDADQGDLP
jgi:hypothetical protein